MKIYKFSCNYWSLGSKFRYYVEELDVDEKPKTYVGSGFRLDKSKIGELDERLCMYSFDPDVKIYISKVIEAKETQVKSLIDRANAINAQIYDMKETMEKRGAI